MGNKTTRKPAQSKGFREEAAQSAATGVLAQQVCQNRAPLRAWRKSNDWFTTVKPTPFPPRSGCAIFSN
jgi:hypothetical protein